MASFRVVAALGLFLVAATGCHTATVPGPMSELRKLVTPPPLERLDAHSVVPQPWSVAQADGPGFRIDSGTVVVVLPGAPDLKHLGEMLVGLLRPATGYRLPVMETDGAAPRGAIVLRQSGGEPELGDEGYELSIAADSVRIVARTPAGMLHGVQTLRQILPVGIEAQRTMTAQVGAWTVPAGRIRDRPRFGWRGAMLDVARHFFTVDEVKQLIDVLALYKMNTLHLHLADDQGWRIQIDSWPRLTTVGGATEVGGGPGGWYTKSDYAEIVRYAGERYVTVVPEIDLPGHTQAAIAAYPEFGCGRRPSDSLVKILPGGQYVGTGVGFSVLCHDAKATWRFIEDVVRELAAMTPGPYLHLGGDEVEALAQDQYNAFIERAQAVVARYDKRMVGWGEIGQAALRPSTIAQLWLPRSAAAAVNQGTKLLMSPGPKTYLDMKYGPVTELGHWWAGFIELEVAYDWDPATYIPGVREETIVGIEAPLWTETVRNIAAAEYLLLPRLPALAEVGWTGQQNRSWDGFRRRIARHAPRWRLLGLNYYPSRQVKW